RACKGNADCLDSNCQSGVCISGTCQDGVLNQKEVGKDCGGPCAPCPDGTTCSGNDADCQSKHCDGTCKAPTCTDGIPNRDEADTDCGGPCNPCTDTKQCLWDVDCVSLACSPDPVHAGQKMCTTPTCFDKQANGQESGLDCGGPTDCPKCPDGQTCQVGLDCVSNVCILGICQVPNCTDGQQNGDETGPDCGGKSCVRRGEGLPCQLGGDCYSTVCLADHTCSLATCSDHIKNQDETATDCGGTCRGCINGQFCKKNTDCASGWCNPKGQVCAPIKCGDGIVQPGETCDD